jgi:integrase
MGRDMGRRFGGGAAVAKTSERLSAIRVANLKGPGYFADGANLYFRIAVGGTRGWIFRFTIQGRTRDMGLGSYPEIALATARKFACKYRELVKQGIDPIEQRRGDRVAQRVAAAKSVTFDQCARQYIEDHEAGWRNAKHRAQWTATLKRYASPVFGALPVSSIDDGLVLRALKEIWYSKPETGSRVRGRVESVLDWARVCGYRSGENPARWKGHLDHLLPAKSKVRRVKHHAALPYTKIGAFIAALRERNEGAARALEFTIFTAARTGEVLGATWDEIDLQSKLWTIAPDRMKAGKEHRVPLSTGALAILDLIHDGHRGDYVFAGAKPGRPLSQMAMSMLLRRMGQGDMTTHGFRSTFRDWAAECTNFPREVSEMALAHAIASAVEAAYRRGDLFDKRRRLMQAWCDYCAITGTGNAVVQLGPAGRRIAVTAARPGADLGGDGS